MALEGSLRDFDLFSLFNMIKTQGKSGILVLSRSEEFVKVFFERGEIVGCDSNQVPMEDRIGAMLVRLGRLSGEELLAMIQRQRQTLKRMGTLLLESGRVTSRDLQDALFNQAMSVIYRTFRWVEGNYRFDSILPIDLDREHFPAIPVDTVLMEAARIMDEWPEVQKRLPDHSLPLQRTGAAKALNLDIDQDLSKVLEGTGQLQLQASGLSHEQETILTYFREPGSILDILQISRYDELDTTKIIADLVERGLLELSGVPGRKRTPIWSVPLKVRKAAPPAGPSSWFWPAVALFLAAPLLFYAPRGRAFFNPGLASLGRVDLQVPPDPMTRDRKAWAFRMASPDDGGLERARSLGVPPGADDPSIPDYRRYRDPLAGVAPTK
jgi:DNA-binding MarR family transcriptional regulator